MKKHLLLSLFASLFTLAISVETTAQIQTIDFESPAGGWVLSHTFNDNGSDYCFVGTNFNGLTGYALENGTNTLLGAEDTQSDPGSPSDGIVTVDFDAVTVTGYTDLTLALDISASTSSSYDLRSQSNGDWVDIEANVDGSGWVLIGSFCTETGSSNRLYTDLDLDGIGQEAGDIILDKTAKNFVFDIGATGASLDFRIKFRMDAGSEEIAIDNIVIDGTLATSDTRVNFVGTDATVQEDGLFVDVCAGITNPSASTTTTVDIDLVALGSTAINGTDYDDGAGTPAAIIFPQTLTFPANSSTDQCLTIYISTDDTDIEADETIELVLENATGGTNAALGTGTSFLVTIEDNDAPPVCLTEGFESGEPGDWSNNSAYYNSGVANGGSSKAGMNGNGDWIVTSQLTNPYEVTFFGRASGTTSNFTINVEYGSSPTGPWTNVSSFVANGSNSGDITTTYQEFTATPNLTGLYYIRFLMSPRSGGSFYLDDVEVLCTPSAPSACTGQMAGIYTINPAAAASCTNYQNFASAVSDMVSGTRSDDNGFRHDGGISGAVTFNVSNGTYTEQLSIEAIPGASAANTITFQSLSGTSTDVTLDFASSGAFGDPNYTLQLNGADYVTFQNMTIERSGSNTYARVIDFSGDASNNTFDSNIITGRATGSTSNDNTAVIFTDETNSGIANNTFSNNEILYGFAGIVWESNSANSKPGLTVTDNTFSNYRYGLLIDYATGLVITGNTITNNPSNFNSSQLKGVECFRCEDDLTITSNTITLTDATSNYGIDLGACVGSAGTVGDVSNNMIVVGGTSTSQGINSGSLTSYKNYYYNSVYTSGSNASSASAFYLNGSNNINVRNNAFVATVGVALDYITESGVSSSDYNLIYTGGANVAQWFTDLATLADFQAASSLDANSVSADPSFVSATDLHVNPGSPTDAAADPISITTDIDGDTRNVTTPDIGADEFNNTLPIVTLSADVTTGTEAGTTVITLTATADAAVTGDQTINVSVAGTGITAGDYTLSATTITILDGQTTGTVTFTIVDDILDEGDETAEVTISHPSSGGYVIGSPSEQDLLIEDNDAPTCYELMISEYHEDGDEKYIEIYNPTPAAIDLSDYSLKLYTNGSATPSTTSALSGTLAAYSTNVYMNSGSDDYAGISLSAINFNGNDAIALDKLGTNIDVVGEIGNGSNFGVDLVIRRNADVDAPNDTYTLSEWTSPGPTVDVSGLGSHTSDCFVALPSVSLSINTAIGTEVGTTEIILTATADAAVTGSQTVVVALSGTGLASTDFTGVDFTSTVNITIADGATTGTLTFNVADDADVEGAETATFTIGSPSAGVIVGTPNSVDLDIADDDNLTSTESVILEQGGEAVSISSIVNGTITNSSQGTQVWQFNLHDGDGTNNDGDSKPTIYEQFTIRQSGGNTVPAWDDAIDNVKFFLGASATPIAGSFLVSPTTISFTPTTPITVSDGTTPAEISMRLTLDAILPAGSDGQNFGFSLDEADVTVETDVLLASQLASFTETSDAALNGINVDATLQFIDAPATVSVGSNFSVTVSAIDANGNIDTDNSAAITLSQTSGSGTLSGTGTQNLVNGTYIFTGLSHDTEETIQVTATGGGFSNINASINVVDEPFALFDDFNRPNNNTVGVPSSETSATYTETGTGNGSRSRIQDNQLLLTNCNEGATSGGSNGMEQVMFNVQNRYETTYDDAGGTLAWVFNMNQNRSNPSGFGSNTYAAGVILGANQSDVEGAAALGYAVIIGNSGDPDPVKLVHFANGLSSNGNVTDIAVSAENSDENHFSVRVEYNPCDGEWSLYVRDDGGSFADPNTGSLGSAYTATDQTHTNVDLRFFGYIWQHGTSCTETATFDNVNIPNATSAATTAKVWNGSVNANWNEDNNWGPCPGVPTITDDVEIANVATQPIISAATPLAVCNNLTVDAGATLTINSSRELTADGNVTNNGTVFVENGANFIQTENGTATHSGSGNFVVRRQGNGSGGFNGWSTPVVGGSLPGSNGYSYNSALGTNSNADDNNPDPDPGWQSAGGSMAAGAGYFSTDGGAATFTGRANNGNYSPSVTTSGQPLSSTTAPTFFNLIGNPYPSSLNADIFISDNSSRIDGALYFWSDENAGSAAFSSDDYATYSTGGAVVPLTGGGSSGVPNGSIPSCQGFFVNCDASGTIDFNNGQRGGSNSQFFNVLTPTHQRMWLSINNNSLELFNQTLIAFNENATDQKDWGVDAYKLRGNQAISIGAQQDGETYVIATYASVPTSGKTIPLMTYVEAADTYTFVADSMEGLSDYNVYLQDLNDGMLYPLEQGDSYDFAMTSNDEFGRFQLWVSPAIVTGIDDIELSGSIYHSQGRGVIVKSNQSVNSSGRLQVLDMSGRVVLNDHIILANGVGSAQIPALANGVYAVQFTSDNGQFTISRKIVLGQ